jgi:hypothetical protein
MNVCHVIIVTNIIQLHFTFPVHRSSLIMRLFTLCQNKRLNIYTSRSPHTMNNLSSKPNRSPTFNTRYYRQDSDFSSFPIFAPRWYFRDPCRGWTVIDTSTTNNFDAGEIPYGHIRKSISDVHWVF